MRIRIPRSHRLLRVVTCVLSLSAGSCASPLSDSAPTVAQAWERNRSEGPSPPPTTGESPRNSSRPTATAAPIATVNNRPIDRDQFFQLLVRSRGAALLEQMASLSVAASFAAARGVSVTESDIAFEYDLALRRLFDPLAADVSSLFDRADAERFLDAVLDERSMSREEYMLTVRRNACLRKVVESEMTITDEQVRAEFAVVHGERVQLRHIQLGSLADATRIRERLDNGEDFAQLATRFSANASTARRGGLLEPFSLADEAYPLAFRQTAAGLAPGQVSDLVRVGEWFHILRLEQRLPAESRSFDDVRDALRKRVAVRRADAKMRALYEKLFREAEFRIDDPVLRDLFRQLHPDQVR